MKKKNIKHESYQVTESIRQYLQQIIDGLSNGQISLSSNDDSMLLKPHGLIAFSLNASQSKSRQQIRLKLDWTPENAPVVSEDDDLTIE